MQPQKNEDLQRAKLALMLLLMIAGTAVFACLFFGSMNGMIIFSMLFLSFLVLLCTLTIIQFLKK